MQFNITDAFIHQTGGETTDCIRKKVEEEIGKGDIGCNRGCDYNPCHFDGQDCSFCYCPFYPCRDPAMGHDVVSRHGKPVWSCEDCLFCHRPEVVEFTFDKIKELGLKAGDPRFLSEVFPEAKRRFWHKGKALMVLGATSDAGKSITVAALCRIFHRMGYLVAPFKSQNMSLNSRVTSKGCEIAMVQVLQARAGGLRNADAHMNPILLKPKGNTASQVIVEGKPFGDYDVPDYYGKFVPGPGIEAVRRNMEFLKDRYDYVMMEGAGSPAEINIYDMDIANMRAAEVADAACILVVNVEWGGSFAYAVGTVELMPEKDRGRIKGIILNNVRGDPDKIRPGAEKLEEMLGIPVIGIIPHISLDLPSEDSEAFRDKTSRGTGTLHIAVVKLPRIANFTDIDPLYTEDTTVEFVDSADGIRSADAIVIPGTKNTIDDLEWLKGNGMFEAIRDMRGKVPILGICGGYQMMGRVLHDPKGIEGKTAGDTEGLGFFDNESYWEEYKKRTVRDRCVMIDGGGEVEGYEIHMGMTDVKEKPLFRMTAVDRRDEVEGSVREDEMLYGTYIHGVLDKPAFRKKFISMIKHDGKAVPVSEPEDYDEVVDRNLDILADGFEEGLDMDALKRIAGVEE
ncbi:cobyric acid synthase [Methanomethylophilus alvi]|uniref:cobyric acid synthase n=1 Tax=Methanomethylophilus alvi TaxID=1291540 RepID=UPI0037DCD761